MSGQFSVLAAVLRALLLAGGLMFLFGPVLFPDQFGSAYLSYVGAGLLMGLILDAGLRPGTRRTASAAKGTPEQFVPASDGADAEQLFREELQASEAHTPRADRAAPAWSGEQMLAPRTFPSEIEGRSGYWSSAAETPQSAEPIGARVLVAEDNPINARLAQCMLQRAGCIPVLVETGRAAIDAVRKSVEGTGPQIDLVLMDVHMPDLDGLTAAREIRLLDQVTGQTETGRRSPPLIAVTANAFAEDRAMCLAAGMDDYLSKPFSWPELHAMLTRWLPRSDDTGSEQGRAEDAA